MSNNQSSATLWVLDTCLIVGLRSTFNYHFDHGFVDFKNVQHRTKSRRFRVRRNMMNITQIKIVVLGCNLGLVLGVLVWCGVTRGVSSYLIFGVVGLVRGKWNTSITKPQRSRAGMPSIRKPATREIISASVELCETEVCFLHLQLTGTNVWLPNMHKTPTDVDFESFRSPAKSESWNNPSLHCCAVFPTWRHCLNSHVWGMYEIKRAERLSHALARSDSSSKFVHGP